LSKERRVTPEVFEVYIMEKREASKVIWKSLRLKLGYEETETET